MKSERVFLMELFLEEELPKNIKLMIKDRFAEMDCVPRGTPNIPIVGPSAVAGHTSQSLSMQRIMEQNPDLIPKPPVPVTPAAAQALAARQALINSAGKESPGDGRRSPRKI